MGQTLHTHIRITHTYTSGLTSAAERTLGDDTLTNLNPPGRARGLLTTNNMYNMLRV